jgi:hypothetical protein
MLRRRGPCGRRDGDASDREDNLAGAVVIDEQANLRLELTCLVGLHLTGDFAGTGWKLGQTSEGSLQTEAAVLGSAMDQADDRDRALSTIVQA